MAIQNIMKIKPCPFAVVVPLLFFNSLAVPNGALGTMSTNLPNYSNDETTANDLKNTKKICDQPNSDRDSNERAKRSVELLINDTMSNITSANITDSAFDLSYFSETFLNCSAHIEVEPECFEIVSNESVFIPPYKLTLNRSDYLINEEFLYICSDFFMDKTKEPKIPHHLSVISMAGSCISALCLILHIIINVCINSAKNLPSYCLLSLCVALLSAYFFTFVQYAKEEDTFCMVVGMFMVYSFLASFFWMNVFSYDIWRSIHLATTKLRLTEDRPALARFARYSLYAWGSPLLIVVASVIVHNVTTNVKYQLIFDNSICWFKHKQALTLYFAGPLFTLLGINILYTVSSFLMISTAATKSSISADSYQLRARLYFSLKLGSSMGLTWIFGVLAIVTKQERMWYLFVFCGALQGVFIFCSFTVSGKSRKECRKALKDRKCSDTPKSASSKPVSSV